MIEQETGYDTYDDLEPEELPDEVLEEIGEHLGSDFVRRNFGTETEEEHNAA